jgi:hypothetical protein
MLIAAVPAQAATGAAPPASLTSAIEMVPPDGRTVPARVRHTLELDLPADAPAVATLSRYKPEDESYRYALAQLLDEYLPVADSDLEFALRYHVIRRPRLLTRAGRATLQLEFGVAIYGDRELSNQALLELGVDDNDVALALRADEATVVPWTVTFRGDGAQIQATHPVPVETDGVASARWELPRGSRPDVRVRAEFDDESGAGLVKSDTFREYAGPISFTLVPAVLLFLAFAWAAKPRAEYREARKRLRGHTGRAILLVLALCASWALAVGGYDLLNSLYEDDYLGMATGERWRSGVAAGLPLVAAAWLRLRTRGPLLPALVAVVAGIAALVFVSRSAPLYGDAGADFVDDTWGEEAIVAGCVVFVASFAYLSLTGIARATAAAAPRERPSKHWRQLRRAGLIAVGLLVAGVVAQWWAWSRSQRPRADQLDLSSGQWATEALGYETAESGNSWPEYLADTVTDLPVQLAGVLAALTPFIAIAGLLTVLHAARGEARHHSLRKPHDLLWLATLIFAAAVVGTGGVVEDVAVPLAFVASLLLFRAAIQKRLDAYAPDATAEDVRRTDLLKRSVALEGLRRKNAKLYDSYSTGDVTDDEYYSRRSTIDQAAAERRAAPSIPDGVSPTELAFALGPGRTWWDNGLAAARLGLKISAVPLAYFVAVVLSSDQLDSALSDDFPSALLTLASATATEVAFWVGAAFVFGITYPHLRGVNGPLKGLALGAVYGASHLAGAIVEPGSQGAWPFRTLTLAIFLVVVGAAMDRETLARSGLDWRHLLDGYRLRDVRYAFGFASSAAVAAIVVAQQIATGEGSDAVSEILKAVPDFLPGPG